MVNEGFRLLEEGNVFRYKAIDEPNLAGMNTRGLFGAGKKNYGRWTKMLDELADKAGKEFLRPRELMRTGGFIKIKNKRLNLI